MRFRAIFLDAIMSLLWAFSCFFYSGIFGFSFFLSVFGVIAGLVFGCAVALEYIKTFKKNGEFKVTLKTLPHALLTVIIPIIILVPTAVYLLFSLGPEARIQMLSFIYPFIPSLHGAKIILYLNWERKHRKLILLEGLVLTRVYTVPRD